MITDETQSTPARPAAHAGRVLHARSCGPGLHFLAGLGLAAWLFAVLFSCCGCEPYAQVGGAVGVETGKTNDTQKVDVNFDGTFKAKVPGV